MKIQRDKFLKILEISRMAVAGSDHLEQLGHFIFGGENLITFNNRLLIYFPFETDFQCSVSSELFYKQLQKYQTKEIEIDLKGNNLEVEGKLETAKLAVTLEQDKEIFSIIDTIREEQMTVDYVAVPEEFVKAVDFCSYSASKNAADGTLCCVCIAGDTVMSTDNYRATKYKMATAMSEGELLLDARIANEIKRFKMTEFGIGQNWLHFKNERGVILSARQIFGDYMDISKAFDFEGKRMKLPKETLDILDFVSPVIANEQQLERKANMNISKGLITASVATNRAVVVKSVELGIERYKDLDMKFTINVDFLRSVLEHTQTMVYDMKVGRAMFQSKNFKHCIRLMPDIDTPEQAREAVAKEEDDIPF
jgi:hypothetical protein